MKDMQIDVHHVTRVEGHGNIRVNVADGKLERCEWQVVEAPRFFEAMVRGRHYTEIQRITSRICGICSVGHSLASVKATEAALGIRVTEQTKTLRRILKHAENFDSHVLHVLFLAAPDLLGIPSVFPLVERDPETVKMALRLKRLGHEWASTLAGRSTHPTTTVPGGFSKVPTVQELADLKAKILGGLPDVERALGILKSLAGKFPAFSRPTEYVGLVDKEEYGLYDGALTCLLPDGNRETFETARYREVAREWVSPLSTAKYARHKMDSYMVGALARFNLNSARLHPKAAAVADELGLKAPCFNPFMNSVAQFVEAVHSAFTAVEQIDSLLAAGIRDEKPLAPVRFGKGASAVEVPRGILFHEYEYDAEGFCTTANCIIPTNQNHANIQKDMEQFVPELLAADQGPDAIRLSLEMLVRAYDPCISCSTHFLNVEFV